MSLCNHWDIICSISDCQNNFLFVVFFHKLDEICFLFWWHSVSNNNFGLSNNFQEIRRHFTILNDCNYSFSTNYYGKLSWTFWWVHLNATSFFQLSKKFIILWAWNQNSVCAVIEQSRRKSYIYCCLFFISGEYPNLDICTLKFLNAFNNTFLEIIFDSSWSKHIKICFNQHTNFFNLFCLFWTLKLLCLIVLL